MSHVNHAHLEGYKPEHVFHDGCPECEERAKNGIEGLLYLDGDNLDYLWLRMVEHEFGTNHLDTNRVENMALRTLYRLYVLLERQGAPAERLRLPPSTWFAQRA